MDDEIEPKPAEETETNPNSEPESITPEESSEEELLRAYYLQQHCRPHALL